MADGTQLQTFFTDQAENGDSDAAFWPGGDGLFMVTGAPDGASVTLGYSPSAADSGFVVLDDALALSAAGSAIFTLPPGWIRATVSSAGDATELTAMARFIRS